MLRAEIQVFRANEAGYHKSGIEVSGKILATIFLKLGASQDDKGILQFPCYQKQQETCPEHPLVFFCCQGSSLEHILR